MIANVSCGIFLRLRMAQSALSCSPRHARSLSPFGTEAWKASQTADVHPLRTIESYVDRLLGLHLMIARQGFSIFSITLLATRMLLNSVSTSLVPRTRLSTALAFSGLPRSTRELGVFGKKIPPVRRFEQCRDTLHSTLNNYR